MRRVVQLLSRMWKSAGNLSHWIWENTDGLTKWMQALVLLFGGVIGGLWAYHVFFLTQRPALEQALGVSTEVWPAEFESGNRLCTIRQLVKITNFGRSLVKIAAVHLKVWRVDNIPYHTSSCGFRLSDVGMAETAKPLVDTPITTLIAGSYVPQATLAHDYVWTFEGRPPKGIYIFAAVAEDSRGGELTPAADQWLPSLCQ